MHCPSCGAENTDAAAFCSLCHARFAIVPGPSADDLDRRKPPPQTSGAERTAIRPVLLGLLISVLAVLLIACGCILAVILLGSRTLGDPVWYVRLPDDTRRIAVGNGDVFADASPQRWHVQSAYPADGQEGGGRPQQLPDADLTAEYSPLIRHGVVYGADASGGFGLDVNSGRRLWSVDGAFPMTAADGAFVVPVTTEDQGACLRGLEPRTGKALWTVQERAAEPIAAGGRVFAERTDAYAWGRRNTRGVICVDGRTGRRLWTSSYDFATRPPRPGEPPLDERMTVVDASNRYVLVSNRTDYGRIDQCVVSAAADGREVRMLGGVVGVAVSDRCVAFRKNRALYGQHVPSGIPLWKVLPDWRDATKDVLVAEDYLFVNEKSGSVPLVRAYQMDTGRKVLEAEWVTVRDVVLDGDLLNVWLHSERSPVDAGPADAPEHLRVYRLR